LPAGCENPDAEFTFELPSGRAREVRLAGETAHGDFVEPEQLAAESDFFHWLRGGDLQGKLDMSSARAEADRILTEQATHGMTVLIGEDGWLTDAGLTEGRPTEDDAFAFAMNRAIGKAMDDYLRERRVPEQMWTFGASGGVKCAI
jgi:hypothetical protein